MIFVIIQCIVLIIIVNNILYKKLSLPVKSTIYRIGELVVGTSIQEIMDEMQEKRKELIFCVKEEGMASTNSILISRELDRLIYEVQKIRLGV